MLEKYLKILHEEPTDTSFFTGDRAWRTGTESSFKLWHDTNFRVFQRFISVFLDYINYQAQLHNSWLFQNDPSYTVITLVFLFG